MNSLVIELVSCLLFVYFSVSCFAAELFDGFLRSFMCVLGPVSLQETEDQMGFSIFYYSYVILLSILGNFMFILSFAIYGPVWLKTETKFLAQTKPNTTSHLNALNSVNQTIYYCYRRAAHICVFTRYDLYALIVLVFIWIQFVFQQTMKFDDFKAIEERIFMKTIDNYKANYSDMNCLDEWCDSITGREALQMIHQFQQEIGCCGWNDGTDWLIVTPNDGLKKNVQILPNSCCKESTLNCTLSDIHRFRENCRNFELPIRDTINPTKYSNFCYGLYPLYKLLAFITYQFSFKRIFDGSALLLRVNFFFPSTIRLV